MILERERGAVDLRGGTGFSDVHLCHFFLSRVVPY